MRDWIADKLLDLAIWIEFRATSMLGVPTIYQIASDLLDQRNTLLQANHGLAHALQCCHDEDERTIN